MRKRSCAYRAASGRWKKSISYPTVKKNLETIIRKMGFEVKKKSAQQEMLEKIRNGELTVDEAITQIKTNQEKED